MTDRQESPDIRESSPLDRSAAATLNDVARSAGVSLATASRALNGSSRRVRGENKERVLEAARLLGYTTNVLAQATVRGTSPVIALLVPDISDPYFGLIASGVTRGADELGLIVTIGVTDRDAEREARLIRALRGQRPQGLVLVASQAGEATATRGELEAFSRLGGRIVSIGGDVTGERAVQIENRCAAMNLGKAMASHGYRSALVIGASEGIRASDERVSGFHEGFSAGGGHVEQVYRAEFSREGGARAMTDALRQGVEPGTLVFGVSDMVAIGAMSAIRDAGRSVGKDIAVCGFNDVPAARDVTPALTTVHVPLSLIGHQAFLAVVDDRWESPLLELGIVVRASTPGIRS